MMTNDDEPPRRSRVPCCGARSPRERALTDGNESRKNDAPGFEDVAKALLEFIKASEDVDDHMNALKRMHNFGWGLNVAETNEHRRLVRRRFKATRKLLSVGKNAMDVIRRVAGEED